MRRNPFQNEQSRLQMQDFRLSILAAILVIFSLILVLRLAYLQLAQYKRYATLSLKNQMSILPIPPQRGIILDRNGVILADNIPVYSLEIVPERTKHLSLTLNRLQHLLPAITEDDIDNFKHALRENRSYESIPLKLHLSEEDVATFASNQYQFSGVSIKASLMRNYPLSEMMAHVVGNVGRINAEELKQVDSTNYRATNFIGKTGIEKYYETQLHGQVGYQQVETDASGRIVRTISKQAPKSGAKLILTLDARLQEAGVAALKGKRGAIVVIDVKNGEVLAMVSAPGFDPNLFVNGISRKDYQTLSNAVDKPLYNRAVRGQYPPASTVKPFVALAGLQSGAITPDSQIYDPGWYRLPHVTHVYRDWKHTGHGFVKLKRALAVSCDTYFYQLGNTIGIHRIANMLTQFGFGTLTHIDLLEEAPGLMPNPRWKISNKRMHWYPGDTLITSIGQGFMLASPLQLANATAALSQEGLRFRPHLLSRFQWDEGNSKSYETFEELPVRLHSPDYFKIVKEGMLAVVADEEGTAHHYFLNAPYTVAGKSGTAQVFSGRKYEKVAYQNLPEALRDHSFFVAFAPFDAPQIAIAVMVEHDVAAKAIAREVLDAYFKIPKRGEKPS